MRDESQDMWDAATALAGAKTVAVLTGAGISAESGVPTFRGVDGLWRKYRAEDLATPAAFARDPHLVWEWYRWRRQRMAAVSPNPGHVALARLAARFPAFTLVTQNVDGLHVRAGSTGVLELHGNIWRDRCTGRPPHRAEHRAGEPGAVEEGGRVPKCHCGAPMRPDVVWFGEGLPEEALEAAVEAFERAQVALVIGTSSLVFPAAALPRMAQRAGATLIEINPEQTPLSAEAHLALRGPSGVILPELERRLAVRG